MLLCTSGTALENVQGRGCGMHTMRERLHTSELDTDYSVASHAAAGA